MNAYRRVALASSLLGCVLAMGAIEGLLTQAEHFQHEDHSLPDWLRVLVVGFAIPFVAGFLVTRGAKELSRADNLIPLFVAPFVLLAARLLLDDVALDWLRQQTLQLLTAGLLAGLAAMCGGIARLKADESLRGSTSK